MERYLILSNGCCIGVLEACTVVLSSSGEFALLLCKDSSPTVHFTKFLPAKHRNSLVQLLEFRNSYSSSPYVISFSSSDSEFSLCKQYEWDFKSGNCIHYPFSIGICPSKKRVVMSTVSSTYNSKASYKSLSNSFTTNKVRLEFPIHSVPLDVQRLLDCMNCCKEHFELNKDNKTLPVQDIRIFTSPIVNNNTTNTAASTTDSIYQCMELFE